MKIENKLMEKAKEEALKILQETEDKSQAVIDAVEKLNEAKYSDLINEIMEEQEKLKSDAKYAKTLNLNVLTQEETNFYEKLKDVKQAITANQIDILPNTIIDGTLDDVKKDSGILDIVNFVAADVKKWIIADKTGTFSWGGLTEKIKGVLSSGFSTLNMEVCKLTVYMVIPKAIRDLALPFVDKYFRTILKEVLNDGLEYGFLQGSGKNEPIGIYKQISKSTDGVHADKTVNTTLTSFKPKALSGPKKYLSKDGLRTIDQLYLICHPNDEADYVAPAIYDAEGRLISSYKNLIVKASANNPLGKAALLIPKKYTMGLTGFGIKEYDQTLALDDADVIIGKAYANGRAVDDNVAYIFDVTKLEEYVPSIYVTGGNINNTPATPGA